MKKGFVFLVLFSFSCACWSHNRSNHRDQLGKLLFGKNYPNLPLSIEECGKFKVLDAAAYLCIDQFDNGQEGKGIKDFVLLKEQGVKKLPELETINYKATGANHQEKTHRGWNCDYEDMSIWTPRKNILLASGKKVFNNIPENELDSICALIYYMHILGDYEGDDHLKYLMPFGGKESGRNQDILQELSYHIEILFKNGKSSADCKTFISFIETQRVRAYKLVKKTEHRDVNELSYQEYLEYLKLVKETMDRLWYYVPRMLKTKAYYIKAFPSMRK